MSQVPDQPNLAESLPADDEISLVDLVRTLWEGRLLIAVITFLGAAVTAGISLVMTPIYKSDIVIQVKSASSKSGGGSLGAMANLAGAANLAGISLKGDETLEATMGVIRSREMARTFIRKHELVDRILDQDQQSFSLKRWLGMESIATDPERRLEQARELFQKDIFQINEDKKTGLGTITVRWRDGDTTARWANDFISLANQHLRQQAIDRATRNMQHLNSELEKTAVVAVRQALFQLIEEQVKAIMLASVESEFAIRVVDPAVKPLLRDSPKRTLMVLLAALASFMLSALLVLVRPGFANFMAQLKMPAV